MTPTHVLIIAIAVQITLLAIYSWLNSARFEDISDQMTELRFKQGPILAKVEYLGEKILKMERPTCPLCHEAMTEHDALNTHYLDKTCHYNCAKVHKELTE